MSQYLPVNPYSEDYLRASELYNNLVNNTTAITDFFMGVAATPQHNPFVCFNGFGGAILQGQVSITSLSPTADFTLFTLPNNCVPLRDTHFPVTVLRSGVYVPNSVLISSGTAILKTAPQTSDVVCLDNIAILIEPYNS